MYTYIIEGNSFHLIEEELNKIIKNNNVLYYNLEEKTIDDVLDEAMYMSLFDDTKYIIVKNPSFLYAKTNDEIERLVDYIKKPNENSIIIFIANKKCDGKKKIVKLIKENKAFITLDNLKPYDLKNRVVTYYKKHNCYIDSDCVNYLVNSSLNNYDILVSEMDKTMEYFKENDKITKEVLEHIVASSLNDNAFKFVSAIVNKNKELALSLYNDLKTLKVDPTMLISLVGREYRLIYYSKFIKAKTNDLISLGFLDFQIDKANIEGYNYNKKEVEDKINYLCDLDYDIKRGKLDKDLAINNLILSI